MSGERSELIAPATTEGGEADESPEEAVADDDADDITTAEEVFPLRAAPAPVKPCAADVEEHNITHISYRSWCDSCVDGRGFGEQRGRHVGRAHEIPIVGIDYWYIATGDLKLRKELVDEYPLIVDAYHLPPRRGMS